MRGGDHTAPVPSPLSEEVFRAGFGTYDTALDRYGDEGYIDLLVAALETGYRCFDTAQMYRTETHLAAAIERVGLADEVFVATKLGLEELGYDEALRSADTRREKLGVEVLDLLYVHVPIETYDPVATPRALDAVVAEGIAARIGLSNFPVPMLLDAMDALETPIFAHQIEMHPLLQEHELHELAVDHGHWIFAFAPTMRGLANEVVELQAVAARHDLTAFEVSLAWLHSRRNVATLTHSGNPDHMASNLAATRLVLDDEDLALIDGIDRRFRIYDDRTDPWNQPLRLREPAT